MLTQTGEEFKWRKEQTDIWLLEVESDSNAYIKKKTPVIFYLYSKSNIIY